MLKLNLQQFGGRGNNWGHGFAGSFANKKLGDMSAQELAKEVKRLETAKDIARGVSRMHRDRIDREGSPDKTSPQYNPNYNKKYTWHKADQSRLNHAKEALEKTEKKLVARDLAKRTYDSTRKASQRFRKNIYQALNGPKAKMPAGWGLKSDGTLGLRMGKEVRKYNQVARKWNKTHKSKMPVYNHRSDIDKAFNAKVSNASASSKKNVSAKKIRELRTHSSENGETVRDIYRIK